MTATDLILIALTIVGIIQLFLTRKAKNDWSSALRFGWYAAAIMASLILIGYVIAFIVNHLAR